MEQPSALTHQKRQVFIERMFSGHGNGQIVQGLKVLQARFEARLGQFLIGKKIGREMVE